MYFYVTDLYTLFYVLQFFVFKQTRKLFESVL